MRILPAIRFLLSVVLFAATFGVFYLSSGLAMATASIDYNWTNLNIEVAPERRVGFGLAMDEARNKIVLFGGNGPGSVGSYGDTWEFDMEGWNLVTTSGPSLRHEMGMVYDSGRNRTVMFGGRYDAPSDIRFNDTWEYDGSDWQRIYTTHSPSGRSNMAIAYDPVRGKVVLFGGSAHPVGIFGDTWEYNGVDWVQIVTDHSPSPRLGARMVYFGPMNKVVLFGGNESGFLPNGTWAFDGTDWTQVDTLVSPLPRYYHQMAYDSGLNLVFLFGGRGNDVVYGDMWEFDGVNWNEALPASSPPATWKTGMSFYEPLNGEMLFGSGDEYNGSLTNISWLYGPGLDPTLTPTPPPTKKVVVVPGIEASWNQDALVNCKMDNYSGDWTMGEVAAAIYYPLLWNLGNAGWDVHIYNYDWRRQFVNHVSGLDNFIDGMVAGGEKVNVVGHSMGGLLGRAYLDEKKENSGVETLVTAGSPHSGTPLAYPAWSAGELWKDNLLDWFYVTLLQRRCQRINGWSDREAIQYAFPAIQNLLPMSDYLIDNKTKNILPVGGMSAKNNWLPTEFSDPFYGVRVGTLSGKGKPTLDMIRVKEANKNDKKAGDWIDGKPVKKINSKLGDGAVLNSSSMLAGADNRSVNKNHLGLVSSEKGVAEILDLLGAPNAVPAFADWNPPDSMLFVVTDSGSPSVISPNGKETKGKRGLANLGNPPKGRYKFKAGPEAKWMGVGRFRKDGRMSWKDFDFLDKGPKLKEIEFLD